MVIFRGFERRSNLQIFASILDACRYGNRKTRVMGICGMSSRQLIGYLDTLVRANLLSVENGGRSLLFRVTKKGRYFLQTYDNMMGILE